jgi:thiosulfate reductase cytochrome b subunit
MSTADTGMADTGMADTGAAQRPDPAVPAREEQRHPLLRRLSHWLFAVAILVMIGSGWRIYNDVPILPFRFPLWLTLGGDTDYSYDLHGESGTANAIAWHLAGMWLLVASVAVYLLHGLLTGHFRRDFLPLSPRAFGRDFLAAARFRLDHHLGTYNAVQKAFYWGALFAILMMVASGLSIWKPVQLGWLTWLFGGFDVARIVHFFFMTAIVAFLVVHVALVALVPKTLVAMTLGRASAPAHAAPAPASVAVMPDAAEVR